MALLITVILLVRSLFRQAGIQDTLKETSDLADSQLRLWEELGQHLDEGLALLDDKDRIVYANQSFAALTGWPNRTAFDQPLASILQLQDEAAQPVELPVGGDPASLQVIAKDGSRTPVRASRRSLHKPDGYGVVVLQDATAAQAEQEIRHRLVNLSSFELRAPVTAMKGYASMLLDGDAGKLPKEAAAYVEPILDSTDKLLTIIDDMAHVEALTSRHQSAHKKTVVLADFLGQLEPKLTKVAKEADRRLTLASERAVAELLIDPDQIGRLLIMLTNTAARTAKAGTAVILSAVVSERTVDITLANQGQPLPKESQANVFDYVGGRGLDEGIGFYVAKQIIESHHAYITVNTRSDGNLFVLSLPQPAKSKNPPAKSATAPELPVDQIAERQVKAAEAKKVDGLSKNGAKRS